ncbi:MAG: DUF2141 domain-containing protein [Candidatus Binataceae bacterium]
MRGALKRYASVAAPAATMRSVICLMLAMAAALVRGGPAGAEGTPQAPNPSRIEAKAVNLRDSYGSFRCAIFNSPDGFPENSDKAVGNAHARVADRRASCIFEGLPPGTYAVAALHDENDNERMDYGFLGMPLEGYGFSSDPTVTFKAPSFDAAKFDYRGGVLIVPIRIHYWGGPPATAAP